MPAYYRTKRRRVLSVINRKRRFPSSDHQYRRQFRPAALRSALRFASRGSNGLKVIIEWQHRGAVAVPSRDLPHFAYCLFTYDSAEDEVRMFIVANRASKPMNRLDDFYAALAAADQDAIEIQCLVRRRA